MSAYENARSVITGFFQTNFVDVAGKALLPVEYPNRLYSPPEGEPDAPWARFSIQNTTKLPTDVGVRSARIIGEATLQIFLPEDSGVKLAREIGDKVVDFMEDVQLATSDGVIRFRKVSLRELNPDNGWDQTLIVMPFQRDIYAT